MAEIQLNEVVKINNLGRDAEAMANNWAVSKVALWDCGPPEPVAPKRPKTPKGNEGDPEYDLAKLDFRAELEEYEAALLTYKQAKIDYADFHRRYGGPYELMMWSADASDALNRDKRAVEEGRQERLRYYISARTRGYEKLKNGGLPVGLKPGHGHAENQRREAESNAELIAARRSDPVFGEQEVRP